MTLILTVFLLVLFNEFVSWIGKSVLQEAVYALYLRLFYSSQSARQRQLKSEILTTKAELMQTSAQDQFAKWAKLRRSVDKGMAELEKLNGDLSSTRSSFGMQFSAFLWLFTTGVYYVVTYRNRNAAVFYLPHGWLWWPIEWSLSLPFAPAGSVSVGVWSFACKRVIKVGEKLVKESFVREPVSVPVEAQPATKNKNENTETKKGQ